MTSQIETLAITPEEAAQALSLIDRRDELLIIQEAIGRPSETYIYSFPVAGQTIEGISAPGAKMMVREMAKSGEFVRIIDSRIQDIGDSYVVTVRAGRFALLDGSREQCLDVQEGLADQPKMEIVTPRGSTHKESREDKFALRKAHAKAVRNAQLSCIPKTFQDLFVASVKAGKVLDTAPPRGRIGSPARPSAAAEGKRQIAGESHSPSMRTDDDATRFFSHAEELGYKGPAALGMLGVKSLPEYLQSGKTVTDAIAVIDQFGK